MYAHILLAYDGTREGRLALREGALMAKRFSASVYLLSVASVTSGARIAETALAGPLAVGQDGHQALFDEAMQRLKELGLRAQGRMAEGEPVKIIAAYAREVGAELVVVGHRKQSFIDRWWSGSTDGYLLDNVECSLLFARRQISDDVFRQQMEGG